VVRRRQRKYTQSPPPQDHPGDVTGIANGSGSRADGVANGSGSRADGTANGSGSRADGTANGSGSRADGIARGRHQTVMVGGGEEQGGDIYTQS